MILHRYIPTKNYRDAWALEKDVHNLIIKMVRERSWLPMKKTYCIWSLKELRTTI